MNKALSSALAAYRRYRAAKANSRAYRVLRYLVVSIVVSYVLLLSFPQVLFAHEISYRSFTVYSREPLDQNIYAVLDKVESRLAASGINNQEVKPKIFLTNGFSLYALLSLYLGSNSFGKGYAEYVAGGSTLTFETGVKMWKANPQDGTGYQYFKYYMLVKYLLEHDKLSVDDLFNREVDVQSLEEKVLRSL